jgi:hypothetical protein
MTYDVACFVGAVITVVDDYYTPGGNVTNGFDIQTPSAIHTNTVALSSDYTMTDGTVFTGEKGACGSLAHLYFCCYRCRKEGSKYFSHKHEGAG